MLLKIFTFTLSSLKDVVTVKACGVSEGLKSHYYRYDKKFRGTES